MRIRRLKNMDSPLHTFPTDANAILEKAIAEAGLSPAQAAEFRAEHARMLAGSTRAVSKRMEEIDAMMRADPARAIDVVTDEMKRHRAEIDTMKGADAVRPNRKTS